MSRDAAWHNPRTAWLAAAIERIHGGEPEAEVLKDYGYQPVADTQGEVDA